MNVKDYIESGILELYVQGQLSEEENVSVYNHMRDYPEILQEVLEIEAALLKLGEAVSPNSIEFENLKKKLNADSLIYLKPRKNNWLKYSGWAASIVLAGGLLWTLNSRRQLQKDIDELVSNKAILELQIEKARVNLSETKELLAAIRDKDILAVPLAGQANYENSYAKVYWNVKEKTIFLDGAGLPEAPEGKVWQVWSLTLDPLTPTSLGTIDDFNSDENKIFEISNANESQAFGITLEPEGGSETPTMEALHTLGVVNTAP